MLACALWPLSLLFRGLAALRHRLYRSGRLASSRLPVPVVVVGNIFIGGTGKTPLTIWLVQALRQAGLHPGVISRGHGSQDSQPRPVTPDSTPQQVGDEPLLIAQRAGCPVMVGRDRAAAGRALLLAHPEVDVLVADDGLQHYALQRDVEIVLFDGRGLGNGWLLPAGPLREAPTRRRDFTVVNTPQLSPALLATLSVPGGAAPVQMQLLGQFAERLGQREERVALSALAVATAPTAVAPAPAVTAMTASPAASMMASAPAPALADATAPADAIAQVAAIARSDAAARSDATASAPTPTPTLTPATASTSTSPAPRIVAAAGIGNPQRFFAMLRSAGLSFGELPLPDHHDFLDRPFDAVDADIILITEKDAVKCAQIEYLKHDPRLWVVPVTATIDAALAQQIVEKCRGCSTA